MLRVVVLKIAPTRDPSLAAVTFSDYVPSPAIPLERIYPVFALQDGAPQVARSVFNVPPKKEELALLAVEYS